jgi:3-oxoadipate enol-lactonase
MNRTIKVEFARLNNSHDSCAGFHFLSPLDNHLWDDQLGAFAQHFKVIRYDIRGFGKSGMLTSDTKPYSMEHDLYSLLQFLGVEKASILGLSMGGSLAINFTLQYPAMVEALITVGAGLSGFEQSEPDETLKAKFAAMDEAYEAGNIARAVEISLQVWTDGPSRTPDQLDPQVRERIRAMTTYNWERGNDDDVQPQKMEPPAAGRLSEIHVPTLIMVGGQDVEFIQVIADTLEKGIAGAKKVVIPGTAHHPNMEKPEEFNQVVIEFLERLK